jgi:tripartite-type tricarboxylate transporter receptor subunit TctC
MVSWYGVFAPIGTSSNVIARLNTEIVAAIKETSVRDRIAALGATPVGNTPKEFATIINNDLTKYEKIIKALNISLD